MAKDTLLMNSLTVMEEDGTIFLDDERIVLTSAAAFGTLRNEVSANIGKERMKGFLIRYGWNLGVNDALRVMKTKHAPIEELLKLGQVFHMVKGHTKAKTSRFEINLTDDGTVESVHVEGAWLNSYEADENIRQFGFENEPVCHTLIGYASGYYSTICKQDIIFKEVSCKGMGQNECQYIGKSLHLWNGEADEELPYYQNNTIVNELKMTYEMLLEERDNLSKSAMIHKILTDEIINGNDLHSIAAVVYKTMGIPIIIEDMNFRELAFAGLSETEFTQLDLDFKRSFLQNQKEKAVISKTSNLPANAHHRIITPIWLQQKIYGYCSFTYPGEIQKFSSQDFMIIERVAAVCSLYLLNEKTNYETMERIKGNFLEQIISGQLSTKKEILKRGSYLQMDLDQPFHMMAIKHNYKPLETEDDFLFHQQIMESTFHYFKQQKSNLLIGQRDGYTVLLVQTDSFQTDISHLCRQLVGYLTEVFPKSSLKIGVSSRGTQIKQAPQNYNEAVIALKIGSPKNQVTLFEELGLTGILIGSQNQEAVKQKAKHLLGPIMESDQTRKTELLKTLYSFLKNGGNLEKTMADLSISMSGLRYRIERIEANLGKNLRDPEITYELLLTLKALDVMGEIWE